MYDLLFGNARIVDGSGSPWYRADLAVAGDRIAAIGKPKGAEAARTIDCHDAVVLSTGLSYAVNAWADTDELVELCKVVARHGGIYVTHMRYTLGDGLHEPIEEAIEIGERAGLPTHISHFKGARGGVRDVAGSLGLIDRARARGIDVTLDAYQYNAGSSMLQALVPMWAHEAGPDK